MSKKLKKKIAEIAGLNGLDWEARQERAAKILASAEWKQSLCNELIGLSFRELERFLFGVTSERQKKEENDERKLEAYKSGYGNRQPKSDSERKYAKGPEYGTSARKPKSEKAGPRTLKEILAQVHAPRVVQGMGLQVKHTYHDFRGTESPDEVLPDSPDGDDSTDEFLG